MTSFNLGGESTTTAKFETVGDSVTGTVVSLTERQSTKLGTDQLDFWPDGKPKMYYSLILQTAMRADANDDGRRSVALTGSRKSTEQSSLSAVLDAIAKAVPGSTELQVGATITMTLVGTVPPKTVGFNPRKLYSASYIPPSVSLAQPAAAPAATSAMPQAAPLIPAAPVVQAAPAAAPQFSAEQIEAMRQAGVDVSAFVTV